MIDNNIGYHYHLDKSTQLRYWFETGAFAQEETIKQTKAMPLTIDLYNDILYKEGREEGREEGIKQIQEYTVLAMFKEGDSVEKIERVTGLKAKVILGIVTKQKS